MSKIKHPFLKFLFFLVVGYILVFGLFLGYKVQKEQTYEENINSLKKIPEFEKKFKNITFKMNKIDFEKVMQEVGTLKSEVFEGAIYEYSGEGHFKYQVLFSKDNELLNIDVLAQ